MPTTIRVSDATWKRLNRRRESGDSFDDVIQDLLDQAEPANNDSG